MEREYEGEERGEREKKWEREREILRVSSPSINCRHKSVQLDVTNMREMPSKQTLAADSCSCTVVPRYVRHKNWADIHQIFLFKNIAI